MRRENRSDRASRRRTAGTLACLLAGLLLIGAETVAAPAPPADAEVTRAVESEFWSDELVDANAIDVSTSEGIVTLSGSVDSILAKERADRIAASIVGVRGVINRIDVTGVERDDDELETAVESALLRDPATDSYEVEVGVTDGRVTLTGTVDSWSEKQLSATVAKGVRGVREIQNEIQIDGAADRSDREIEEEIEARLENDVRVDDYGIAVAVEDGVVTLSGTVGSLAEKRRAGGDAWVAGVKSVDTDALDIEWWARDEMRRDDVIATRSDEKIAEAVRDAFFYDPRVSSFDVDVHAASGAVTLSGVVDNLAAKEAAEEDARNVTGVWRVQNHLKVRPQTIPPDEALEGRVAAALAEDEYVERWEIDVSAHMGRVYLSGNVDNSFEKEWAESLAERTNGTVRVFNNIEYEHEWDWKPDWEIREQVNGQLTWSPFVDADDVEVDVNAGVVTLTGKVDTWAERSDAEENAWEGGAKDVRNELAVESRIYGPIARFHAPWDYRPYP